MDHLETLSMFPLLRKCIPVLSKRTAGSRFLPNELGQQPLRCSLSKHLICE